MLAEMAKKWQRLAILGGRRMAITITDACQDTHECGTSIADKGHFVIYTSDSKRFVVPLAYLGSRIFEELFRMSEEEFGLPGDGPIMLPCDAMFMEYVISLLRRQVPQEVEKALLSSMAFGCSYQSKEINKQYLAVCTF